MENHFFSQELKSQAAKILGSVDFLGNPLGLFNDVTEGISGLLNDGNVGGLIKNVTHGVSNSAAKVYYHLIANSSVCCGGKTKFIASICEAYMQIKQVTQRYKLLIAYVKCIIH